MDWLLAIRIMGGLALKGVVGSS